MLTGGLKCKLVGQTRIPDDLHTIIGLMNDETIPCLRPLICPVCSSSLELTGRALACLHGHSFDLAREGYVNLMTGHRRRKILGDDKAMLVARRRFLDNGRYHPLADAINTLVKAHLAANDEKEPVLLDIGCGEGYYLRQLRSHLPAKACVFGLDAAKDAVRSAARGDKTARFIAADVNRLIPFADHSVNVLLNIFAPRHAAEFARIAAPGALLLIVIPQPNHLQTLREELGLMRIESEKRERVIEQMNGRFDLRPAAAAQRKRFSLRSSQSITIQLNLTQPDLTDLVQMTPNYRHLTPQKLNQLQALTQFQTTASFELLAFEMRDER